MNALNEFPDFDFSKVERIENLDVFKSCVSFNDPFLTFNVSEVYKPSADDLKDIYKKFHFH